MREGLARGQPPTVELVPPRDELGDQVPAGSPVAVQQRQVALPRTRVPVAPRLYVVIAALQVLRVQANNASDYGISLQSHHPAASMSNAALCIFKDNSAAAYLHETALLRGRA